MCRKKELNEVLEILHITQKRHIASAALVATCYYTVLCDQVVPYLCCTVYCTLHSYICTTRF